MLVIPPSTAVRVIDGATIRRAMTVAISLTTIPDRRYRSPRWICPLCSMSPVAGSAVSVGRFVDAGLGGDHDGGGTGWVR
jgi:hypothetical protein